MKRMSIVAAAVFAAAVGAVQAAQPMKHDQAMKNDQLKNEQTKTDAVSVAQSEIVAKVEKVDRKGMTMTVKGPKGRRVKIDVPQDVQNLDEIKAGTTVKIRYLQGVALAITEPGAMPAAEAETVRLAPEGVVGETVVDAKRITGKVQNVDRGHRELTIKAPEGLTLTLKAAEDLAGFDKIKVGDTVGLRYTEAVALEVAKKEALTPETSGTMSR